MGRTYAVSFLAALAMLAASSLALAAKSHGIAMHGEPALPAGFQNFPYANPDAPKGGRVEYAWPGTFDSINPFIVQGSGARGSIDLVFGNNVFDTLMMRSADEPFTLYPLLAETIETDDGRTFAEFTLDPRARFSDGQPVTPDDVIFTVNLLRDKGLPRYGVTADKIATMEKVGERGVRFTFKQPDRELPLILGLLPVLPRHAIDAVRFDKSTLKPMIGSGPYRLVDVRPGDSVTFKRNPDYWAKDIPSKRGFDNYDEIRLTYFRDENALFEALKKGLVDVFIEENSGRWANQYDFPAVKSGALVKDTIETKLPSGMFGIVLNTRRPALADRKLRDALTALFDFEWVNRSLFSNSYTRTRSFFDNSELASSGRPASAGEKVLLAPFPDVVEPDIMTKGWQPPTSDGTGRDRAFLRVGFDKLKAAGYELGDGLMRDKGGRPLTFEIMLKGSENQQLAVAFQQTLRKLGITLVIRSVDAAQFLQRQIDYDFDMMFFRYTASLSPGVEQASRWGSEVRDTPGTFNYAGVASPAVDALLDHLINARTRPEFVDAVRAFDRVLLSGAYVIPLYFKPEQWIVRWKRIERPDATPIQGAQFPTWWRAKD
ncbi:extracellular solute-binding protein [Arvimicrobium flavum]|uniref:extracellular solute-binding protein n=1 Tax=Arvimicrobium flavum TaxID=3393320 RepID=UPI00237B7ECA|nr:extracellular solute-binding protein [Mesorhizobium shangrilense]